MKNFLSLFLLTFLLSCGGNTNEHDQKTLQYYDSLTTILKHRPDSSSSQNVIVMDSEAPTVGVEEPGKILITLPQVNQAYPIVIDAHIELANDTVRMFRITAGRSSPPKSVTDRILPGDTKTKIAQRLGVPVTQIKNKEPLKVGEIIQHE